MAYPEQFLLFPETLEEKLDRKMREYEKSHDKMRKSLFAKQTELMKMMQQQQRELEEIKELLRNHKTRMF